MKTLYKVPQREWITSTKDKLDALDETLSRVETRLADTAADVDEEVRSKVIAARVKIDDWRNRWGEARETTSAVWDTISNEVATAWEANRAALETSLDEIGTAFDTDTQHDPARPEEGNTVFVHYRGRLEDGTEFQSTRGRDPIEFELGASHVAPGIEKAVADMHLGEARTVQIPRDDAFGARDDTLVFRLSRELFEDDNMPGLGDRVTVHPQSGKPIRVTVRQIKEDIVEVDANHPLAGQDLSMDLELVGIS